MAKEIFLELFPIKFFNSRQKKLALAFYNKNFPLSRWSEQYFDDFLRSTSRPSLGFYIKENNHYIGLVLGRINKDHSFNIATLLVKPTYQGRGLGRDLIEKIIFEIRKNHSIKKIYLHFRDQNDLEKFYARLGFGNHSIKGAYRNGDNKHYMDIII